MDKAQKSIDHRHFLEEKAKSEAEAEVEENVATMKCPTQQGKPQQQQGSHTQAQEPMQKKSRFFAEDQENDAITSAHFTPDNLRLRVIIIFLWRHHKTVATATQ